MDMGVNVSAKVLDITGGGGIFGYFGKNYGCNIEITKKFLAERDMEKIRKGEKQIRELLDVAKKHEKVNSEKAIELYREAIAAILGLYSLGGEARWYLGTIYPINRLSLLLEKLKEYESGYNEILRFEECGSYDNLTETDKNSVIKRKTRLKNKLK